MKTQLGAARSLRAGVWAGLALVAATTAVLYPLKELAPVEATGAVYLVGVMVVSIRWGAAAGLITAVLSAAAWNLFHIPPTGRFTIAEGENWVALAVFLIAAVLVSRLAENARRRAEEAERRRAEAALLADLARDMLATRTEAEARAVLAERLAAELGLPADEVQLDTHRVAGERWLVTLESEDGDRFGALHLPASLDHGKRETVERLAPSLGVRRCGRPRSGRSPRRSARRASPARSSGRARTWRPE